MGDLVDFSECEYISNTMKYYTYKDFINNCQLIKNRFNNLSRNGKKFYMWYVFANIHTTYAIKCKIWGFLNNDYTQEDLNNSLKQRRK